MREAEALASIDTSARVSIDDDVLADYEKKLKKIIKGNLMPGISETHRDFILDGEYNPGKAYAVSLEPFDAETIRAIKKSGV